MSKLERSKNAKRNIIFGLFNRASIIFFPFLSQTFLIHIMGAEYSGLKGLFSSVLAILNLAELGIGSSIVFSMYKPISENNKDAICCLLNFYKKTYRIIGVLILIIGIFLLPYIPKLVNSAVSYDINLSIIYFMYLINSAMPYFMFSYKLSLFFAFQRTDVVDIINTVITIILSASQVIAIIEFKNYYLYMIASIFSSIFHNIVIYICVNISYPDYRCAGEIDADTKQAIIKKIKGLVLYRVCGTTRNSFDNIFISMYLGLTLVGIYNNYFYILTSVSGILGIFTSSILAGIGNSVILDTVEKNYQDMRKINFLYMSLAGWASVCMLCLYQPFMSIWVGDNLTLPFGAIVLITLYFYILRMGDIRGVYSDAKGLWWENRYRTIMEAITNIILNYLFVKIWGIYGIILATIISLFFFGFISASIILFRTYFKNGIMQFFSDHLLYFCVNLFMCIITYYICNIYHGNSISTLLVRTVICCTIPILLYYIIYSHTNIFKITISWVISKVKI